jgi:hypothetical protein
MLFHRCKPTPRPNFRTGVARIDGVQSERIMLHLTCRFTEDLHPTIGGVQIIDTVVSLRRSRFVIMASAVLIHVAASGSITER